MASDGFSQSATEGVLQRVPVELGNGKVKVPLAELLPSTCTRDLMRILEDYERDAR